MGSRVRRNGDTWTAYVDLGMKPDGARDRRSKGGFDSEDDAQAWLATYLAPDGGTGYGITIGVAVQTCLDALAVENGWKGATHLTHSNTLRRLTGPHARAPISEFSVLAKMVYAKATHDGLAPTTLGPLAHNLERFGKFCVDQGWLQAHPERTRATDPLFLNLPKPKQKRRKAKGRRLTRAQVAQLRESVLAERPDLWPPLMFMLRTGLRKGEMLALQWGNISEDGTFMEVRRTVTHTRTGKWTYGEPKTDASWRPIELAPAAQQLLEKLQAERSTSSPQDFVFVMNTGQPWNPSTFDKYAAEYLTIEGETKFRIHDLRHTFASSALAAKVPLKVVSEALGHSKTGITADLYTHTDRDQHADAMAKVSDWLDME
jgi:integrase